MYEQVVNDSVMLTPLPTKNKKQIQKLHRNLCHIYHTPRWMAQQKRLDSFEVSGVGTSKFMITIGLSFRF